MPSASKPSRSGALIRHSVLVFAGSSFLNAAGFIYHAIASRSLGADTYGTLYALLAFQNIVALPGAVAVTVLTRFAAEFRALDDRAHLRGLVSGLGRALLIGTVCVAIASIVFAVPLAAYLHAPVAAIPATALLMLCIVGANAYRAVAQGLFDFEGFAISNVVDGSLRILATLACVALGWKFFGALGGYIAGSLAGTIVMFVRTNVRVPHVTAEPVRYDWRRIGIVIAGTAAMTVCTTLLANADVIVAKHAFDPSQAGVYAAASLVAKILLFGVGFIPLVLLPQASDRYARGERSSNVLWLALGAVAIAGAIALAIFRFFGGVLLHMLVGGGYDAAMPLLVPYGVAMFLLSLVSVVCTYGIATHRLACGWAAVAGAIATTIVLVLYHPSSMALITTLTIGAAFTAVIAAVTLAIESTRKKGFV